ncbi:acyl dehydratase [Brachybacterium phenoliresistens]|uniref:Acyl dehydratase n=1 Tax=Brachybacterium phenoliresistens TaxID=396014 RepID=Z9JRQ2_9MICO|nr:MaoC/PaaZ C-terminal domain-containing protein [Brachybacterium phenoliresistens]EWS80879.1 acyl dehydratase [Brachybacterium phenoliresistens]
MTTTTPLTLDQLETGQELAAGACEISRDSLVRYAGASGDFNPIHYNDTAAREAGLPGVIAHGMLTMGTAVNVVADALGEGARITACSTRFSAPLEVPATGSVTLAVRAVVGKIDTEAGTVQLSLEASVDGTAVLGRARVSVQIDERSA